MKHLGYIDSAFTSNDLSTQLKDASDKLMIYKIVLINIEKIADPWMDYQNNIINNGKKYAKVVFSIIMVLSLGMTGIYVINYIDSLFSFSMFIKNNYNCCLEFTYIYFQFFHILFLV